MLKLLEKFNVSEAIIRFWRTQLDKLKKASKHKEKIIFIKVKN